MAQCIRKIQVVIDTPMGKYEGHIMKIVSTIFRHRKGLTNTSFVPSTESAAEELIGIYKELVTDKDCRFINAINFKDKWSATVYEGVTIKPVTYIRIAHHKKISYDERYIAFINSEAFQKFIEEDEELPEIKDIRERTRSFKLVCINHTKKLEGLLKEAGLL